MVAVLVALNSHVQATDYKSGARRGDQINGEYCGDNVLGEFHDDGSCAKRFGLVIIPL